MTSEVKQVVDSALCAHSKFSLLQQSGVEKIVRSEFERIAQVLIWRREAGSLDDYISNYDFWLGRKNQPQLLSNLDTNLGIIVGLRDYLNEHCIFKQEIKGRQYDHSGKFVNFVFERIWKMVFFQVADVKQAEKKWKKYHADKKKTKEKQEAKSITADEWVFRIPYPDVAKHLGIEEHEVWLTTFKESCLHIHLRVKEIEGKGIEKQPVHIYQKDASDREFFLVLLATILLGEHLGRAGSQEIAAIFMQAGSVLKFEQVVKREYSAFAEEHSTLMYEIAKQLVNMAKKDESIVIPVPGLVNILALIDEHM